MNILLRVSLILAVFCYFLCIYLLLHKRSLQLKYTLLWLLAGVVMLIIICIPEAIIKLTRAIGVIDTNIGILAIVIFMLIVILMSITSIVSKIDEKNKKLVQTIALLEYKVIELEKKIERRNEDV